MRAHLSKHPACCFGQPSPLRQIVFNEKIFHSIFDVIQRHLVLHSQQEQEHVADAIIDRSRVRIRHTSLQKLRHAGDVEAPRVRSGVGTWLAA